MSVPPSIPPLVQRFRENLSDYRSGKYNETQVRLEFINPFFEALGWDVNNTQGYAEAYKDVVHEDAVKVSGATKAPDYGFRIGGTRKFFVEAKKPSVNLKDDISPAFQLRRYAWSAKLPLSMLTDFEELAVYDCRTRPVKTDKASTARVMYVTFDQYAEKWEELASVFSREAVLKGSFDRYAEATTGKHGTQEVDDIFLAEIERWRELLARNIALRNPGLSVRDLNYAVQLTIDRLVFLRIGEDRGFEPYERLRQIASGKEVYARLLEVFREADARYNSGLFHLQAEKGRENADTLTPRLVMDDKVFKDILGHLYYPDSPYDFNVMPADILGQVYEQFLGKVIRLTKGGRAEVEDKPEVKKAGGVFYTPTYIVDYIVKHTVGKLVDGKTPDEVAHLKICDPACGSGSFLLGAYQFLLDWHLDWYMHNKPERWARGKEPRLRISGTAGTALLGQGEADVSDTQATPFLLTTAEKRRILLNNLYGVDIDPQAVEVTKLSLLLKVLEGENEGLRQLALFHERVLPDLNDNIKCGNSLIGPDFYEGEQLAMFDLEESYRINAFDWQTEFPQVFRSRNGVASLDRHTIRNGVAGRSAAPSNVTQSNAVPGGGFDAVIGNPPYIRMEEFKDLKNYLKSHYQCHDERSDLYAYFIEQGHKLLRQQARFGMIVSNKFLRANYGKPLREFLLHNASVNTVVDFAGLPVFKGATVRTIVLLTQQQEQVEEISYTPPLPVEQFRAIDTGIESVENAIKDFTYSVSKTNLEKDVWSFTPSDVEDLFEKLKGKSILLGEYSNGLICMGVKSGLTKAFVIDAKTREQLLATSPKAEEIIKPFVNGRDIRRYHLEPKEQFLIYTYRGVDISQYPAVEEYLKPFKQQLLKRATKQEWYELQQPQYAYVPYFESPKIIFPDIAIQPRFTLDDDNYYGSNTIYFIAKRDLYLLGLLNSSFGYFYFKTVCAGLEGQNETYLRFFGQYLEGFPVVEATEKFHDRMVTLVQTMLDLHKQLAAAHTPTEKTMLQRQIASTDKAIDQLVYALYGLTAEEIQIVEGN